MPAFKRFGPGDQVDNVLILEPQYDLVSGSTGWRGSPNGSASLSLYGGARRSPAGVFQDISYQSLYPNANQTGNPHRGEPLTASVNVVWMTNETLNKLTEVGSTRWGDEHWSAVQRLYQDYYPIDADYVTASYDHYVVYFQQDSRNVISITGGLDGSGVYTPVQPTGSFTLESWFKPFSGSYSPRGFTIQSRNNLFWLGMTGSAGVLHFSASNGIVSTSSLSPSLGLWNHVAVSYDSTTYSGTIYLNLAQVGEFTMTPLTASAQSTLHSIGNVLDGAGVSSESVATTGTLGRSFHGFIGESRYWSAGRSYGQISSSWNSRLTGSGLISNGIVCCVPLNDGPLSRVYTFPMGSGALDHARYAQGAAYQFARFLGFDDRVGPVWQPSDNTGFYAPKQSAPSFVPGNSTVESASLLRGDDLSRMVVIDIPQAFYGRNIVPGSVRIVDWTYSSASYGLIRTIVDDERGNLYVSASLCSGSISGPSVGWNKVGNVFYGEGLITIKDPALFDIGRLDGASADASNVLQLSFRGQSRIPVKTLMCRIDRGEFNASTNPTFYTTGSAGERIRRHESGSIRATTVGLYNSDRELVGVARLADPIRIRSRDKINIKIRMDF